MAECSICADRYSEQRTPKTLNCGHTFCILCLKKQVVALGRKSGEMMPCPMCWTDFKIPIHGIVGLPTNYALQELMNACEFREKIQSKRAEVSKNISLISDYVKKLNKQESEDLKVFEKINHEIDDTEKSIKELLDKHKQSLIDQINTLKRDRLELISEKRTEIDKHLEQVKSYEEYCDGLATQLPSFISDAAGKFNARTEELIKSCKSLLNDEVQPFNLDFEPTSLQEFTQLTNYNLIGEIKEVTSTNVPVPALEVFDRNEPCTCSENVTYVKKPELLKSISLFSEDDRRLSVTGMAILGKKLFVISGKSSRIHEYNSRFLNFQHVYELGNDLTDPQDIVSCARNSCLYVIDWKTRTREPAEIIRLNSRCKILRSWSEEVGLGRLSVTNDSNILLAVFGQDRIIEYSSDGEVIHVLELNSIDHPVHATKLPDGHYLLCFGHIRDSRQGICKIDKRGNVDCCFDTERDARFQLFNSPMAVASDDQGSIWTVWTSGDVVLLDSNLQFEQQLLSRDEGLRFPGRMLLDASDRRLFIADNEKGWRDGDLLVFSILNN